MAHLPTQSPSETVIPPASSSSSSSSSDWSAIETWLATLFPPSHSPSPPSSFSSSSRRPTRPSLSLPTHERNPSTLSALRALQAHHERATTEARLFTLVENDMLLLQKQQQQQQQQQYVNNNNNNNNTTMSAMRSTLLDIIEAHLPHQGKTALAALASLSVAAQVPAPEADTLAAAVMRLQTAVVELEALRRRTEALHHLVVVASSDDMFVSDNLTDDNNNYNANNATLLRAVDALTAQIPAFEKQITAISPCTTTATTSSSELITIHDILHDEKEYLALMARKKVLEQHVALFRRLPTDPDQARTELDAYRRQLQGITSRRDAARQGLAERQTQTPMRTT